MCIAVLGCDECVVGVNVVFVLVQRAQAALQAVNAVQTASVPLASVDAGGSGSQSPVLRVIVENLFYPVTLEVLHQVTDLH